MTREGMAVSYAPQYITGGPQFKQPSPSEKDRIRMFLSLGLIFFFIGGLVFSIWGAVDVGEYAFLNALSDEELKEEFGHDYISATTAELRLQVTIFLITGTIKIIFGILGFLLGLLVRMKATQPLEKGEYEEAGRFLNILMIMGFIFGLFLAGFFLFKAKNLLKSTAVRSTPETKIFDQTMYMKDGTGAQEIRRCGVCNSILTFNPQTKMWLCTTCNKYQ